VGRDHRMERRKAADRVAAENGISLQDSLTRAVTRVLRRRIGEPMLEPESGTSTRIPAAWDAMLRARHVVLAFDSLTRAGAVRAAVQAAAQADSILSSRAGGRRVVGGTAHRACVARVSSVTPAASGPTPSSCHSSTPGWPMRPQRWTSHLTTRTRSRLAAYCDTEVVKQLGL
jgi:hypothetical protein